MTEQPKQKKQQTTDPIQIGLVENDPDYHRRIESELNSLDDPYKLRIWNSAESFWRDAAARKLDLLLLDIKLPGMDGVELAGRVAERDEHIRIVMLSNMNSDRLIFQALRNGAVGYILKSELNDIPATVRTIMDGGAIITPTIAYRVMSSFKKTNPVMGAGLTEREKQVLELMVGGKTIAKVADMLKISSNTVNHHAKNIYRKLNVHNRSELSRKAASAGLLDDSDPQ